MAFHTKTSEAYGNIRRKPNQPCNYLNRGHTSKVNIFGQYLRSSSFLQCLFMTFCNCVTSLESRDPEIGRGVPNARAAVKNKQTNDVSIFYITIVFCAKYIDRTTEKAIL